MACERTAPAAYTHSFWGGAPLTYTASVSPIHARAAYGPGPYDDPSGSDVAVSAAPVAGSSVASNQPGVASWRSPRSIGPSALPKMRMPAAGPPRKIWIVDVIDFVQRGAS